MTANPGTLLRPGATRLGRADGGDGGRHDVPDDGLHRLRQPADPLRCGDAVRRGVRSHLRGGRVQQPGDGPVRQLPDRARARDGAQRLLRLRRRARARLPVGGGARCGVPRRRALPAPERPSGPAPDHRGGAARAEAGHPGRHRPVPRDHRAHERGHHPGERSNAGHDRRPGGARAGAGARRLLRHRGPRRARRARRIAHRDARRRSRRARVRRLRVAGHRVAPAQSRRRRSSR